MVETGWWVVLPAAVLLVGVALAAPARAEDLPDFDALWNFSDPAATEAKFRELLPRAEASGDAAYLAELRTQIARTLGLQARFAEAHALLDEIQKGLPSGTKRTRVRYLLERGRAFRSGGSPDKAKPLFLEAWDVARDAGLGELAGDAGHMVAMTVEGDEALAWGLKTLAWVEASPDPGAKRWIGTLCNNLGWARYERGDAAGALELFQRYLAVATERKRPAAIRIAKWSVARMFRALGRLDDALAAQRELEKEFEAAGAPDGYVFEEIGELLLATGKPEEAKPNFAKAYAALKDVAVAENVPTPRLARMRRLGGVAGEPLDGPGKPFRDDLIERLLGEWRIKGKVGAREIENRGTARWVLDHQFVELHLVDAAVPAKYEAIVMIGYSHADERYVAHWCDTFGGAFSAAGRGKRTGDAIELEFAYPDGPFFTTFAWDAKAGGWTLRLETVGKDGARVLFAEETLRRP